MFGSSNQRVGLDIGTFSIKLVIMDKVGGRVKPIKMVKQDIYPDVVGYDPEGPKRSVAVPALSEAFKKAGILTRKVKNLYSNIGGAQVSAKEITAIHLDDEEMASAMLLEARKHIPLDGSSTIIDYQILGEHPKEPDKVRVLIAATTKKLFEAHADILRDLELKPGVVDIDQLATINSYIANKTLPDEGVVVFLNVGTRKSSLTVFGKTDTFFTRDIPIAGHAFTEELSKKFGISYREAEEIKITQGMDPDLNKVNIDVEEPSLRVAAKTTMDKLGDEINRSLRYYVKESGQNLFTKLVLTGGSAGLKGLDTMLNDKFKIPVEIYDPAIAFDDIGNGNFGPQFAVAIGLAMRGE